MTLREDIVAEVVAAILKGDRSYCDCRRSPFDGHDYNPPCETVKKVREQVRLTLDLAFPQFESSRMIWAIFPAGSFEWSEPLFGLDKRFPTRDAAQAYVEEHLLHPESFEVRGRVVTGWKK